MKTVPLGELVDFYSGGTPSKSNSDFWRGDVPWFSAKDMKRSRLSDSLDHVSERVFDETSLRRLPKGTIAMVVRGMILAHTVPISILDVDAAINQDLKALIPKRPIHVGFLAAMLRAQHASILSQVSTAAHGTKKLESRILEEIPIPDVPPDEQRRIATILDHADAIRTKRRQILAHLDTLTQSIFHDMFGKSADSEVPLSDLVSFYSGGTPSKSKPDYWVGELPWFSAKDLKAADLYDSQDHISPRVPVETSLRLLPSDTIALVVRGMILAHTIPISVLRAPATINQDLKALLPKADLDVDFLAAAMRSRANWLLARVSTAAHGTKKLQSSVLESVPIPVPSMSRQREFAARVDKVNIEGATVRRALTTSDELFTSLQTRAFTGAL